ncbi:Uncharacterised protein [Escherichia coli]|uniref:Lipoprotein n=1 Tax=Escherichia coli TaxID=562 RepID=A0A376YMI2_ECOLX|nr:Uncharacterised protein [Escherichia coli]
MSLTKLLPVILLMMATGCRPPPGMKLNDSGIRRVWLRSLHNRQQTRQPGQTRQKSRLPAGSASARQAG